VKWIKKREDVYRGKYEEKLPDIFFELEEEYGVGMDLFTSPITENFTHKKISGGHKREAVLIIKNSNAIINKIKTPSSVLAIKDFVTKLIEA